MGNVDDEITLLTGATGFVGSLVLERLIERGDRVLALIRGANDEAARNRLEELAEQMWGDRSAVTAVEVMAADLERDRLGLDEAGWDRLASRTRSIIHCA